MPVDDLRVAAWSVRSTVGSTRTLVSTWTDADGAPFDLDGHTVALFVGDDEMDIDTVDNVATITLVTPDDLATVDLLFQLDGEDITRGSLIPSERGTDDGDLTLDVSVAPIEIAMTVIGGAAGGGAPSGPAGGDLTGTYPNPTFAVAVATQAALTSEAATRAAADTALDGRVDTIEAVGPLASSASVTAAVLVETNARIADVNAEEAARIAADLLLVPLAQKGAASGVAPLGADSLIPTAFLPPLAINETFTVASQAAMLALTAQRGDVAVRTDLDPDGFFFLTSDSPGTLADWKQILAPHAVVTVDGRSGAVTLTDLYDASGSAAAAQAFSIQRGNHSGTQAIATVVGLQGALDAKALAATTISAGSGLTGGGDLSANRSLAADFGTGAGKVTQGNDSRLSDARTPTAHAASHGSGGDDPVTVAAEDVTVDDSGWTSFSGPDAQTALDGIQGVFDILPGFFAPMTPFVLALTPTTGTIDLDMATLNGTYQTVSLTGNPTFTSSNRAAGRTVTVKLVAGGSSRTITWPAWIPLGAALPTSLASGKVAVFTVTFWDTTDAAATAAYAAQP